MYPAKVLSSGRAGQLHANGVSGARNAGEDDGTSIEAPVENRGPDIIS